MKTAAFKYTDVTEIPDSSLAVAVYYNSTNYTMSIQFKGYSEPSAIYGAVSKETYESLIRAESLGTFYNTTIKPRFPNLSNGTVYHVQYTPDESVQVVVKEEEGYTYKVDGYIRHSDTFHAKNREEARQLFLDSLTDEGYAEETLAVTEVVILG